MSFAGDMVSSERLPPADRRTRRVLQWRTIPRPGTAAICSGRNRVTLLIAVHSSITAQHLQSLRALILTWLVIDVLLTADIMRKLDTRRWTCDRSRSFSPICATASYLRSSISKAITISAIRSPAPATQRAASNVIKVAERRDDLWMGFSAYWNASWGFRSARARSITFGWPRPSNHNGQEIWIRCRQQKISWSNSFFPLSSINSLSSSSFCPPLKSIQKAHKSQQSGPRDLHDFTSLIGRKKERAFSCVELTFLRLKCVRFSYFPGFFFFFQKERQRWTEQPAKKKGATRYIRERLLSSIRNTSATQSTLTNDSLGGREKNGERKMSPEQTPQWIVRSVIPASSHFRRLDLDRDYK